MAGGQVWGSNTAGGFMYSDELSDELRMAVQPLVKFRQLCDAKDATQKGLHAGDKFHWNVYSDVATGGGEIGETDTMPETNFKINQGTLVVTEYGNSVPFTQKLDNLSKQSVKEVIQKVLKNDASKTLDKAAHAQFAATPLVVAPAGGTSTSAISLSTDGTTSIVNNVALGKDHVKAIGDLMKERNIPPFMGSDYMAIGHPSTFRNFKNELEAVHQYTQQGFTMILNGEIGRYEGCRFLEQTNISKESWSNNKSNWAYFFGADTVAEAIVIPEEMRGKIPGDYGRSKGIAWYYLGGYGLVHGGSGNANARILKWGSAS